MSASSLSMDRKAKRPKRKRKEETPQLNTYESVPNITDVSFPWISSNDTTPNQQPEEAWPYILYPKVKAEKYRVYADHTIYGVAVQTEVKKERHSIALSFQAPHILGSQTQLNNRHDFSKTDTENVSRYMESSSVKKQSTSPIIKKKVPPPIHDSTDNVLPKYISDFAPYGYTPVPDWLRTVIPASINRETVLQAGKPWHDTDKCTWANELNYLSTEPNFKRAVIKHSPALHWGESLCTLQHHQYLVSYGKRVMTKPRISLFNHFENKDSKFDSKPHIISHLAPKLLTEESLRENASDSSGITEIISDQSTTKSELLLAPKPTPIKEPEKIFNPEKFLIELSYSPRQMIKKPLINRPNVRNFDASWSLTIAPCKWPKFVAKSTFFKSLIKNESLKLIIVGKKRDMEQWPYSPNMVKVRRYSENKSISSPILESVRVETTKPRTSSEMKRRDSRRSRSRLTMSEVASIKTDHSKKRKSSISDTNNMAPEESKKKIPSTPGKNRVEDEIPAYPRPPNIIEYVQNETMDECILAEQNKFPGVQVQQSAVIQPHSRPAPFQYRYSNLSYFEKNYSHFLHRKKTSKIAYYYAKPYTVFGDLFDGKTNLDYASRTKFVEYIQSNNIGKLYYPNGRLAVCCKNDSIGSYPIRRYVIFDNIPTKYLILAVFDSLGNGIVYDKNGRIRLNFSQNFGTLSHTNFGGTIKWRWHNIPIRQAHKIKNSDSLQTMEQPHNEMEEMRSRGVNLFKSYLLTVKGHHETPIEEAITEKKVGKIKYGNYTKIKPFQLRINENMILKVRDQKHITLWFHGDEKDVKLELGVILQPSIQLRQVEIDSKQVLHQNIPLEFEKIIGNTDSLLRILESVGDGGKLEPYFEPCDQLIGHDTQHSLVYDVPPPTQQTRFSDETQVEDGMYQIVHSVTFSEEKLQRKKYHGTKFKRQETKHLPSIVSGSKIVSREIFPVPREVTMSKMESFQMGKSSEYETLKPHILSSSVPVYTNVTEMIDDEVLWRRFVETKHRNTIKHHVDTVPTHADGRLLSKKDSTPFVYFG